jgi:signal peptidase II
MLGVAAVSVVADLWSKEVAFERVAGFPVTVLREQVLEAKANGLRTLQSLIPAHEPVVVAPKLLNFTLVLNPGAVFGIGAGQRWFFIFFTTLAIAFGLYMFMKWTTRRDRWAHVALGLLIGGGIGNLYDRWVYACVRDFIAPLPGVKFPFGLDPFGGNGAVWPYVSNVADAILLVGIGILAIFLWRKDSAAGQHGGHQNGPARSENRPDTASQSPGGK